MFAFKRALSPALTALALVGALFVAGCGNSAAAPAPTATATATLIPSPTPITVPAPSSGFTTYKSTDGAYGFNYPSTWSVTSQTSSGLTFQVVSNNSDLITVVPTNSKIDPTQYATFLQSFAQGAGGTNVKVNSTTQQQTLGQNTWTVADGTLTFQGKPYQMAAFGTDHGSYTTLIIALAPTATADADATSYIIPLVTSFTFLK